MAWESQYYKDIDSIQYKKYNQFELKFLYLLWKLRSVLKYKWVYIYIYNINIMNKYVFILFIIYKYIYKYK